MSDKPLIESVPLSPEARRQLTASWSRPVEIKITGGQMILRNVDVPALAMAYNQAVTSDANG